MTHAVLAYFISAVAFSVAVLALGAAGQDEGWLKKLQANLEKLHTYVATPNEGFHEQRLVGLARNDVLGTLGLALIVAAVTGRSAPLTVGGFFLFAIVAHTAFHVPTALNKLLGLYRDKLH